MGGADLFCGFLFWCAGAYCLVDLHAYADLGGSFVFVMAAGSHSPDLAFVSRVADRMLVGKFVEPGAVADTIVINKPWFASWTFKIILALVPTVAAYAVKYKHYRNHRHDALID